MDHTKHDPMGSGQHLHVQNVSSHLYAHAHGTARMLSATEPNGTDEMDMKFEIHRMETEAYSSVLQAFVAQSDLLSWGKEGLITELRKELNVTDIEHGELLVKINSDESIKMIREWQKGAWESQSSKMNAPGFSPCSAGFTRLAGNAPYKKMKSSHASVSKSLKYVSQGQPSSAAIPSLPAQFRDNQRSGKLAMFSTGKMGQPLNVVMHNVQAPSVNKDRGPVNSRSKKGFHAAVGDKFKRSDMIEIRATDKLIHEVERLIYSTDNPDPVHVEKAKLILQEHERSILEALSKLADLSDEDDLPGQLQPHYFHKALPGIGRGTASGMPFN